MTIPNSPEQTANLLSQQNYVADHALAVALYLALSMQKPLFLEGEAGVGKTEISKVLATSLNRRLLRLQCYEGMDIANAAYEWNYPAQMLDIRMQEAKNEMDGVEKSQRKSRRKSQKSQDSHGIGDDGIDHGASIQNIYRKEFLIERPLLAALRLHDGVPPILLIDELDRTDEPFEAYLLEVLSEFQITIPELGTIHAERAPIVIITSNRTREIHDAVKRRCIYHWVDYPSAKREYQIVRLKAPNASKQITQQMVDFVQLLRQQDIYKPPGVAECIDWVHALIQLGVTELNRDATRETLGVLLKYKDDMAVLDNSKLDDLLSQIS